jgi:hypothetical protein
VVIGESSTDALVQHSSKLAMQARPATFGLKLGGICRASSFLQLMGLNHLWFSISSRSLPQPLVGFFVHRLKW